MAGQIIVAETACVLCFERVFERGIFFFKAENSFHFRKQSGFEVSILDYTFGVWEQIRVYGFLASFVIIWDLGCR